MNTLSFYDRSKAGWTLDEANAVRGEYETEMLNILDIADLHRRTPGSIAYKLKSMGIITDPKMARGYDAYKAGSLYKEIVSTTSKEPSNYVNKTSNEFVLRIASNDEILAEVKSLKSELSELKSDFQALKSCLMLFVDKMSSKAAVHSNRISEATFDIGDEDLERFFEV